MRIWLVTVGEPLPNVPESGRLLRTGILSALLARQGHEVVWWSSTFDHARKRFHDIDEPVMQIAPRLELRLLHGPAYRSNVSIARLINHHRVARAFLREAPKQPQPDMILCSFPTIELSVACTRYGKRRGVPVVLDMRDMWPDIFLALAPPVLRPIARMMLGPYFRWTKEACTNATAIFGITPAFVDWGVTYAGREKTELDRDFAHGYTENAPEPGALEATTSLWRERGLRDSDFIACFFGILGRQFDLATVIAAARRLASSRPNLKFVICGSGENLAGLRADAGSLPNVLFPGWIDHAQIWSLMRMSKVGLAPYHNEHSFTQSIPNKAIEYLSAGLPIVTCLRGVLSDVVTRYNCGFIYPSGNAEALAAILARLHDDDSCARTAAANGLALYRSRFIAEDVYARMAQHLQRIAETSGGPELTRRT